VAFCRIFFAFVYIGSEWRRR